MVSRRKFVQLSSAAAVAAAWGSPLNGETGSQDLGTFRGTLCLFSKPVPQLQWKELAQRAKAAGFGGIDLTVRAGGHVEPDRAAQDLPRAVEAIRGEGMEVPMITTELQDAEDPTAEPIISTAGNLSIPYMKAGYYHYDFVDIRKEVEKACSRFRGLVGVAANHGVQVGWHNHAGYIGCQFWEIAPMMESLNPKDAGYYYDLDNATMEGSYSAWKIDASLAMPRIKMMAVKDFYWKQVGPHQWTATQCPLGQGMCRYHEFLTMVAKSNFHGPITLHLEYQMPGVSDDQGIALNRAMDDRIMEIAQRDLNTLKSMIRTAYTA